MRTKTATGLLAAMLLAPAGLVVAGAWGIPGTGLVHEHDATTALVQDLLALRAHPSGDALGGAVQLALLGSAAQARIAGLSAAPAPALPAMGPGAALAALATRHGATLTPATAAQLAALDAMPEPGRDALARVVTGYLALEGAAAAGFAGMRLAPEDLPSGLGLPATLAAAGIDLAPALAARATFLEAVVALPGALERSPLDPVPERVEVPGVFVIDLTEADNTYPADLVLVVDKAGHDLYLNNAGGNHGFPAAALVDYTGDDRYLGDLRSGANGGGFRGVGVLVDGHGDDVYLARDDGTNGGAFMGAGMLLDADGDDAYPAWGWGANGGGYPGGIGFLLDYSGNDAYSGWWEAVNGGGAMGGSGFLFDGDGHDTYTAMWGGTNGGAEPGGRGVLVDAAGDDAYVASALGVNGGSTGGIGFLWDDGGRDLYDDREGGSGTDVTVVPKGAGGAQVDR